jgi:outer membrane autotransporter protein
MSTTAIVCAASVSLLAAEANADAILVLEGNNSTSNSNLKTTLESEGHTVTSSSSADSSTFSGFQQIWDLRYTSTDDLNTLYSTYLNDNNGIVIAIGEHPNNSTFVARNDAIIAAVLALGGGTLTSAVPADIQDIASQFSDGTDGQVDFTGPNGATGFIGGSSTTGIGTFVTSDTTGKGTIIIFDTSALGEGSGLVAFDINWLDGTDAEFQQLLVNLIRHFTGTLTAENQQETIEATTEQTTRSAIRSITRAISTRISVLRAAAKGGSFRKSNSRTSSMTVNGRTGMSSGDGSGDLDGLGIWGDISRSEIEDNTVTNQFNGDTDTASIGVDYIIADNLMAGLIASFNNTDITLETRAGKSDVDGYGLTGYGAYIVNENILVNGFLGVTRNSNDISETQFGAVITGDFRSYNYSSGVNGSYTVYMDPMGSGAGGDTPLSLTGSLGYNYSQERFSSYTASDGSRVNPDNSSLGQGVVSGEAAYTQGIATGYINLAFEKDFVSPSSGGDDNGAYGNIGLTVYPQDNLTANLNVGYQFGRSKEKERSIGASLRYTF